MKINLTFLLFILIMNFGININAQILTGSTCLDFIKEHASLSNVYKVDMYQKITENDSIPIYTILLDNSNIYNQNNDSVNKKLLINSFNWSNQNAIPDGNLSAFQDNSIVYQYSKVNFLTGKEESDNDYLPISKIKTFNILKMNNDSLITIDIETFLGEKYKYRYTFIVNEFLEYNIIYKERIYLNSIKSENVVKYTYVCWLKR